MANDTNNVLRIKVGVAFDPNEIAKEFNTAKKQAEKMQKDYEANAKGTSTATKAQDALNDSTKKANDTLNKQNGIWSMMTKNIQSTIANFLKFTVVSSVFMAVTVTMRAMLGLMFELDEAYTNLKIVSGATAEEMANIDDRIGKLSISLGRLKKEVVDATTEFLRAGYGIDASMTLAENAIKGANVGAVELADVTTYLIAGLRAFNFEAGESSRILDVLFQVSNVTAINLEGIGEAFLRSANTLRSAGATLEQASALISGANESIQDPSKVGTALKTIATRLRGVSEDGEIVPTLEKDFKNLGIEIRNSEGGFRNIYDIFKELSVAIKGVDDLTKQSILEKLAGKRQVNILQGLLNDFDVVEMSLEEGLTSFGKVSEAQEIAIQSLNGRMNILKESVGQLLTAMSDSEGLKIFIDGITAVIKALTGLVNIISEIPNAIKIIGGLAVAIGVLVQSVALSGAGFGAALVITQPWLLAIGAGVAVLSAFSLAGKDAKKTQEELNAELKKSTELQGQFSKKFLQSSEQDQRKVALSIRDTLKALKELRAEQSKESTSKSSKLNEEFGIDPDKASKTEKSIKQLTQSLLDLGFSEKDATRWMEEYGNSAVDAYDRTETLTESLITFRNNIKSTVSDTELLVEAKNQMNDTGVIELDTLDSLLLSHAEFADVLGTTKKAQLAKLDALIQGNILGSKSDLEKLKEDKLVLVERLGLFQKEILGRKEVLKSYGAQGFFSSKIADVFGGALDILSTKKEKTDLLEIENAEKKIAQLTNSIGLQENLSKIKDTSSKKEEKVLTAQEKALADINYQIELQQKLITQLEGTDRENAQRKLIELYSKQKTALNNVSASLNKTKLGTDEYTNQVRDLALKVEDANVSIFGLNNEIADFHEQLKQDQLDKYNKKLDETKNAISKFVEEAIDGLEKLKDSEEDAIQARIDNLNRINDLANTASENEIDGLNRKRELEERAYDDKLKELLGQQEAERKLFDAQKEAQDAQDKANEIAREQAEKAQKVAEKNVELQELLIKLADIKNRKEQLLAEKTVLRVNDANIGYEYITDPREIEKINEEIFDAENDVRDKRAEIAEAMAESIVDTTTRLTEYQNKALEDQILALEQAEESKKTIHEREISDLQYTASEAEKIRVLEIEKLELEKERISAIYEARLTALKESQDAIQEELETNGEVSKATLSSLMDNLGMIEGNSYTERLTNLTNYVEEYNRLLGLIGAIEPSDPNKQIAKPSPVGSSKLDIIEQSTKKASGGTTASTSLSTATKAVASSISNPATTVVNNPVTYNGIKITTPNVNKVFTNFKRQTGSMEY